MIPLSSRDAQRVAELRSFNILDTSPEEGFDSITRLVAATCAVPIALLSFVDTSRQWFKSRVGVSLCETSRDSSFCSHAIADPSDIFLVPDALLDPRFCENPLVVGEPHIRFYAGVRIVTQAGFALGTLCVIDRRPRVLTPAQRTVLQSAASTALSLLSYRRAESELRKVVSVVGTPNAYSSSPKLSVVAPARSAGAALANEREIPTAVIDALPGVFFVLDSGGQFLLWNRRLEDVSGYTNDELQQLLAIELFEGHDRPRVTEQILLGFVQGEAHLDAALVTKAGTSIPHFFTANTVEFKGRTYLAGMGIDISDRKRAEEMLRHSSLHDPLTGLANRLLMEQRLAGAIVDAQRDSRCAAVVFLDLDRFKNVNDTLGHRVGDELLMSVGRRLQGAVRASDTVARIGGDEFVIIADLNVPADGSVIVQQLLDVFREPFSICGMVLHATASMGVSISPDDGIDAESLLRNADVAMYIAKDRGRNQCFSYAREMHVAAARRLTTENDLRRALENDEFELFYQPAVDLQTGHAVAAEALIRWHHPSRGLLAPNEFIDIAEETGLIVPMGAWVLEQGARQAKRLGTLGIPPCHISVNVSGRQLRDPAFLGSVRAAIQSQGLEPEILGIEITESAALGDPDAAQAVLLECKRLGLLVLLDDFGTHYSSLTYAKKFPIDIIKIDKSFVDGLSHDADDQGIVKAIIGLASSLDCDLVAEGVETEVQARWLTDHRCHIATGYYYARPMPAEEFEKWLWRRSHEAEG
jgi:diguanylate cyclase (GGDEF)-like protein/PAS domain S-box-containing protein